MSIEKDVEKLYLSDIEKQKKKQKKKNKKRLLTMLIVVIILVAIFLLMNYLGLGLGGGKGNGGSSGSDSSSAAESSVAETTTTTAIAKDYIDIKVSGSTYIYSGQETTVESFADMVKLMADNVVVNITDDNATKNAMDKLVKALDDNSRDYILAKTEDSSSVSDSNQQTEKTTTTTKAGIL